MNEQYNNDYNNSNPNQDYKQILEQKENFDIPEYVEQNQKSSGFSIAGFVLSFFVNILGLIFSIIGINKSKKAKGKADGLAVAGLVISIISIVFSITICFCTACLVQKYYNSLDDFASSVQNSSDNYIVEFNEDGINITPSNNNEAEKEASVNSDKNTLSDITLEDIVEKTELESLISNMEGDETFKDVDVTVKQNNLKITYTLNQKLNEDTKKTLISSIEGASDQLKSTSDALIKTIEDLYHTKGISITYAYFDNDNNEIWSKTFQ